MENIKEESIKKLNKAISECFSENFIEKEPFIVKRHDVSLFSGRRMVLYNGKMYWADYDGKENTYLLKEMDFVSKYRLLKGDDLIIEYKQNISNKYYFDNCFRDKLIALKTLGYTYLTSANFENNLSYCEISFTGNIGLEEFNIKIIFDKELTKILYEFVLNSLKVKKTILHEQYDEIVCWISLDEMIDKKEEPRFIKIEKGED